jgi:hypothetical protein
MPTTKARETSAARTARPRKPATPAPATVTTLVTTDGKPQIARVMIEAQDAADKINAAAPKASPVRSDVKPSDVKPDAHTPAETKRIASLENLASKYMSAGENAALKLAETIVALFPLKPWEGHKLANGHPMTVKAYYAGLGIGADDDKFSLPLNARRHIVREMANTVDVDTVVAMTGSSNRTIQRDRIAEGLANENRSESHRTAAEPQADDTPAAAPAGPVTRMVPVLSMTSVREFISSLDDDDMLEELADLIAERRAAL